MDLLYPNTTCIHPSHLLDDEWQMADISNVETVIIDGVVQQRDGRLVKDLTAPRGLAEASRDYRVGQVEPQPGWVIRPTA
jgi:hypothetical protein